MSDIETVVDNIEANEREGKPKYKVLEYANRIERQLKSIADVLVSSLGPDIEPIQKIIETYLFVGDSCPPNWLLKVDHWAEMGERDRKREKQAEADATVLQ